MCKPPKFILHIICQGCLHPWVAGAKRAACKDPELSSAHGHTKLTPICRTVIREKDQSQHRRSSTTEDIKKEPRQTRRADRHYSGCRPPKRARLHRGGSPVGARARSPYGSPARGPALGRGALGAFGFEGWQGLTLGAPRTGGNRGFPGGLAVKTLPPHAGDPHAATTTEPSPCNGRSHKLHEAKT